MPERPSVAAHERVASVMRIPCDSSAERMESAVAKSRCILASARARSCAVRSSLLIVAPGGVPV